MAAKIKIDLKAEQPAYRQIADGLRRALVNGELQPGDALPPVRQLAVDLGVHFNTVAEAYRTLAEEGWLELKRKRGAQVLDRKRPTKTGREEKQRLLRSLRELVAKMRSAGLEADEVAAELRQAAKEVNQ